jgi:hypothetical protein
MLFEPEDDPRTEPPLQGDERATLVGFLAFQRETFALKCAGVAPEDMARRGVPPSTMSLLGLVRHMAEVERNWFKNVLAGRDDQPYYYDQSNRDGDFDDAIADSAVIEDAWARWRGEVSFAEEFVAAAADLDLTGNEKWRGAISLRWVLVHMIEEYARHNGHADLLREQVDGWVGE